MFATIKNYTRPLSAFLMLGIALMASRVAEACPSCYGSGASGPMVDGMNSAILVMLGIIGVVLAFVAFFFIMMLRRAHRLHQQTPELSIQA